MIVFKNNFLISLWFCIAGVWHIPGYAAAVAPHSSDEKVIQVWMDSHVRRVQGGEQKNARSHAAGDLDGDGRSDLAVLYTIKPREARRGESRYLAVFRRQRGQLRYHAHVLVSGPGAGEANRVTVLNRVAVVEMLVFAPGDARCCPTRPATRRYRLDANGLTLIPPKPAARKH